MQGTCVGAYGDSFFPLNLRGSNRCECDPGYAGDGFVCAPDTDGDGFPDVTLEACSADCVYVLINSVSMQLP